MTVDFHNFDLQLNMYIVHCTIVSDLDSLNYTCPHVSTRSARRTAEDEQTQSQVGHVLEQQLADDEREQRHEEVVSKKSDEQRGRTFDGLQDHICVKSAAHVHRVQTDQDDHHDRERGGQLFVLVDRRHDADSFQQRPANRLIVLVENVHLREANVLAAYDHIRMVRPFADLVELDEIVSHICDRRIIDVEQQARFTVEIVEHIAEILLGALLQLQLDVGLVERMLEFERDAGHIADQDDQLEKRD